MSVNINDIRSLSDKKVYETSNEKYVLAKDLEKIVHSPEFSILGFLNNYMYAISGIYLVKCTLLGEEIAQIKIDLEHATFNEKHKFFYAFYERTLYKITENLEIEWVLDFEVDIKSITMDIAGCVYILFDNINHIKKFLSDGTELMYITGSDDINKSVKLFDCFVSKGGGWLYVIGTEYWGYNYQAQSFIDRYNVRTGDRVERNIFKSGTGVSENDPSYHYNDFYMCGDYFYIYGDTSIFKINIKGVDYWNWTLGYNKLTKSFNSISSGEYTDNTFTEFLYFVEDYADTNGHAFGKINTNGKMLWRMSLPESVEKVDFRFCVYKDRIYTTAKTLVSFKKAYILEVGDRLMFKTRDGHLIEILEYNENELYAAENYYGYKLLGDKQKEGIDTITYFPLMHDYGQMVDEDQSILLLPLDNESYTSSDNYDYFYLKASDYSVNLHSMNILFARNGKALYSKLANVLKTKEVYETEKVYEYITTPDGEKIGTLADEDIIRSRFEYAYDKYLLADKNKFYTSIITKTLGDIIITKKHGHTIIRKTREIYHYLLSRYNDISLIEEWLKENGVSNTSLPKYVDELRHHTIDMINDVQVAGTPVIYDVQSYKQFSYTYDGTEYPIRVWGTQIFSCTNLPFNKRKCQNKIYIDSLANLVEEGIMRPCIFFLNGKAIPWSECTIVKDWSYTYLVLTNTDPYETNLNCIMFPCNVRYGEDNNTLGEEVCDTYFYFNKDGVITYNHDEVAIRIEVIDVNVVGNHKVLGDYIEIENNYKQLASDQNIFVINDGIIDFESRYYITDHGKDIFTYNNPSIKANDKHVAVFYWIKANDYYGTLYKIPNGVDIYDYRIDEATGAKNHTEISNFLPPFQFKLSKNKTYDTNIAQAVEYIMGYDMSLLIDFYKESSDMKSYTFTGAQLIDRVAKDGGWLVLPRSRKDGYDDCIIVFKNCQLYEFYNDIIVEGRSFKIPIFEHIAKTDVVEILHFRKVNNSYHTFTVSDKMDYLPEGLRYDNFLLFGNSPSNNEVYIPFNVETSVQYGIDFEYKNSFFNNGKYQGTEIKLSDPYYNDKVINICSKRQFQYMFYNIMYDKDSVNLAPQFKFCHQKNHYMVFKNGRRLCNYEYDLNIPTLESPSKYISMKFATTLVNGDKIDIFYLPSSYEEIHTGTNMKLSNDVAKIQLNMEDLGYPFDKDLFMVFTDGNKLNYNFIDNVNIHTIDILVKELAATGDTTYDTIPETTCVLKFMQEDELLNKLFSYSDQWTTATDALTNQQYINLLTKTLKK